MIPTVSSTPLVLTALLLLASCVSYDVPKGAVGKIQELYGVSVISTSPPYRIYSVSQLQTPDIKTSPWNENTLKRQAQQLVSGQHANWRWSVWATPDVIASWRVWNRSPEARRCKHSAASCSQLDWNTAFTNLYVTVTYLLGKPPLPMELRLNLIPEGQAFQARLYNRSRQFVPLEFTFWFPSGVAADFNSPQAREEALIYVVTTVGYEFQHVEYAAGDSTGPASPRGPHFLKDEANSTCWQLASRLVILAGRPASVSMKHLTQEDLNRYAAVFGSTVEVQTAALWGPILLQHDLGEYLASTIPADSDTLIIRVHTTDYSQMNKVLAYCRGFTRYGGDVAKQPMLPGNVAHTPFWK